MPFQGPVDGNFTVMVWGLCLKICQGFDQYANVRSTRILPGIDAPIKRCRPQDLNWVIVRENSEDESSGVGGRVHQGHPIEAATDITKSNPQRHAMVMWDEIAAQVAPEFSDVKWDKEIVDAATAHMVNRPATLDTIVATTRQVTDAVCAHLGAASV